MTQTSTTLRTRGQGPDLAYLPGIDGTGEFLLGNESVVARAFRVHCLRYQDDGQPARDSCELLADSAVEALRAEGVQQALVLAESFGGGVALTMALRHPDFVRGLGLVNTFCHYSPRARLGLSRLMAPLCPPALFRLGRRLLARWSLFGPLASAEALAAFRALPGAFFDGPYRRRLRLIAELDLRARLSEITCPTTVFWSTGDRVVAAGREARVMLEGIPGARELRVDRGGHLILPLGQVDWVGEMRRLDEAADRPASWLKAHG